MLLIESIFEFLFFTIYLNIVEALESNNLNHYWNHTNHFFNEMTKALYPHLYDEEEFYNEHTIIPETQSESETKREVEVKYEDKYLNVVRAMVNEYIFTKEEKELEEKKYNEYMQIEQSLLTEKKIELEKEIQDYDVQLGRKEEVFEMSNNLDDYEAYMDDLEKKHKETIEKLEKLNNEKVDETKERENARKYVIMQRNLKLKNSYVMETTPVGNVVMFYNVDKEAFEYYSDHSVPYRFLDVVARKYVKVYNCRPLYVDMEEELNQQKEKKKKMEEEEQRKKQEEEQKQLQKQTIGAKTAAPETAEKKSVFTKFKSYNKEAGSGRVNSAPPPKNSIPNKSATAEENKNVCLKERANHYTCEGRFANFNILKKINRKVVDKKYAMTFADFKKMQKQNNK
jgi:hypothetical protein